MNRVAVFYSYFLSNLNQFEFYEFLTWLRIVHVDEDATVESMENSFAWGAPRSVAKVYNKRAVERPVLSSVR